jgi:uncharacterized protein YndB with AHSA1/START domain
MNARRESALSAASRTKVEAVSEHDLVISRTFNGPARSVFAAWTEPELLKRWWVPKDSGASLASCEMDARTGGTYRLVFASGDQTMAFHGRYLEVIPNSKIVWTNEESEDGATTTLTLQEQDGKTLLVMHERYPSKQARDNSLAAWSDGMPEWLEQLEELLDDLRAAA